MSDYNIPQGTTQTVGDENGANMTVEGNSTSPYGAGGGMLIEDHDANGANVTVTGGTFVVEHDFNGGTADLDNATFSVPNHDANGATVMFSGVDDVILSSKVVMDSHLENINFDNFGLGDRIELAGDTSAGSTPTYSNGTLSFTLGGVNYSVNMTLAGGVTNPQFHYGLAPDGDEFLQLGPVCFLAGSRILTPRGEIAVEDLAVGDAVITLDGDSRKARPVIWIGSRTVRAASLPEVDAYPVRIRANAFGDGVPHRNLLVTPEHCVFVDDGLIPARLLVNGGSIVIDRSIETYTFYHVELERHAILLAEGLAAESYLDTGNRANFANAATPALRPTFAVDAQHASWETDAAAPLTVDPATVEPIWRRLAARSDAIGMPVSLPRAETDGDGDVHVLAHGRRIAPRYAQDGRLLFPLPDGARSIMLASRASSPASVTPWLDDRRRLGVSVADIAFVTGAGKVRLPVDHPALATGWHATERSGRQLWRWTDGAAELPVPSGAMLVEVRINAVQGGAGAPAEERARAA